MCRLVRTTARCVGTALPSATTTAFSPHRASAATIKDTSSRSASTVPSARHTPYKLRTCMCLHFTVMAAISISCFPLPFFGGSLAGSQDHPFFLLALPTYASHHVWVQLLLSFGRCFWLSEVRLRTNLWHADGGIPTHLLRKPFWEMCVVFLGPTGRLCFCVPGRYFPYRVRVAIWRPFELMLECWDICEFWYLLNILILTSYFLQPKDSVW